MLDRLRGGPRAHILADMERLCDAYIHLANWNIEAYKRETSEFNGKSGSHWIRFVGWSTHRCF